MCLTVGESTDPAKLNDALKGHGSYCLAHDKVALIFDAADGPDTEDVHHEHFRLVCLALKDHDITLDVAGCIFDVKDVLQAGFQLDSINPTSVIVIDLMAGQDDDDSDDEEGLEDMITKFSQ